MYQTLITIQMTPEQLGELIEGRVNRALAPLLPALVFNTPPELPEYLTRKESAKLLRTSLVTLHKLTNEGILQSLDIDGNVRYKRDDIIAAIKERKNDKTKR